MNALPLGRRAPTDDEHVRRYPLSSAAAVALEPTPVVIGVNWYSGFDRPKDAAGNGYREGLAPKGGHWLLPDASKGPIGQVRGGHCVCLLPVGVADPRSWWDFYDQGQEGACVGFGASRLMSLLNRRRYVARWLWDRAKEGDEWPDTNPGDDNGTSVRAALDVLRTRGHVVWRSQLAPSYGDAARRTRLAPSASEGIAANRWITSMDDLLKVLGHEDADHVDVVNSWGRAYPHLTRMPLATMERLWREDGEVGVVVDR
jgi:hypothetical protein